MKVLKEIKNTEIFVSLRKIIKCILERKCRSNSLKAFMSPKNWFEYVYKYTI